MPRSLAVHLRNRGRDRNERRRPASGFDGPLSGGVKDSNDGTRGGPAGSPAIKGMYTHEAGSFTWPWGLLCRGTEGDRGDGWML